MKLLGMRCIALPHSSMVGSFENWEAQKVKSGATQVPPLPCWGDYIPSYVLHLFEQHQGGRTRMQELAVLASALGNVAHGETVTLLSTAYSAQDRHTAETLHGEDDHRIVTADLLFHAMPDL